MAFTYLDCRQFGRNGWATSQLRLRWNARQSWLHPPCRATYSGFFLRRTTSAHCHTTLWHCAVRVLISLVSPHGRFKKIPDVPKVDKKRVRNRRKTPTPDTSGESKVACCRLLTSMRRTAALKLKRKHHGRRSREGRRKKNRRFVVSGALERSLIRRDTYKTRE